MRKNTKEQLIIGVIVAVAVINVLLMVCLIPVVPTRPFGGLIAYAWAMLGPIIVFMTTLILARLEKQA